MRIVKVFLHDINHLSVINYLKQLRCFDFFTMLIGIIVHYHGRLSSELSKKIENLQANVMSYVQLFSVNHL